jgi:2'-hydroxyisoflavone reductase
MTMKRRDFVRLGAMGALGASVVPGGTLLGEGLEPYAALETLGGAGRSMKVLVLGGTSFLGPAQVSYLLERGHAVTLFNRGRTNPDLFPGVERLVGDRSTTELDALRGREWDAVIDNSATVPRWVRESAGLLADHAGRYLYVSSISVYSDNSIVGMSEDAPVHQLDDPDTEDVFGANYGGAKALCEQYARDAFGDRATVVRPGLIVGPRDGTDRFTYWPLRVDRGGEILAPGNPADPVQFIDVRDLGEFMVRLVENGTSGDFNATGPLARPLEIGEMIYGIKAVSAVPSTVTWVPAEFLAAQQVRAWQDMPAWIPPQPGMEGFSQIDVSRAVSAGMTFRPLAVTAEDTLAWTRSWSEERKEAPLRFGLSAEREAAVLAAWHARSGDSAP